MSITPFSFHTLPDRLINTDAGNLRAHPQKGSFPLFNLSTYQLTTLLLLFLLPAAAQGQGLDDVQTRTEIGLSYKPDKRWTISPKYLLYTNNGGTHFSRSMVGIEANYKVYSWLKLGAEYRFSTSYGQDFHRMRAFAVLDYNYKKWQVQWRPMYQRDQDYFNAEYLSNNPAQDVLRNRVLLTYHYKKKLEFFTGVELYHSLNYGAPAAYRTRPTIGLEYLYKKRNSFTGQLYYIRDYGISSPQDRLRVGVGYTRHVGKLTKKGKGKKKKADPEVSPTTK